MLAFWNGVSRIRKRLKQFLRGAESELSAGPPVEFAGGREGIFVTVLLKGYALRKAGSEQTVLPFILGARTECVGGERSPQFSI